MFINLVKNSHSQSTLDCTEQSALFLPYSKGAVSVILTHQAREPQLRISTVTALPKKSLLHFVSYYIQFGNLL